MFALLWRKLTRTAGRRPPKSAGKAGRAYISPKPVAVSQTPSTGALDRKVEFFQVSLHHSPDLTVRRVRLGAAPNTEIALLYIEGLVDQRLVAEAVLVPLMHMRFPAGTPMNVRKAATLAESVLVTAGNVAREPSQRAMLTALLSGKALLVFDEDVDAIVADVHKWESRAIEQPPSEPVSRGPREGFVETLQINTSLLRRRIKNDDLVFESLVIGRRTETAVVVAYIKDLADPDLVQELMKRLQAIDIDGVLDSSYLQEFITDVPVSLVPSVGSSERPDVVAARLLEGRAAVLVDGTPFVLTVPSLLVEAFQSPQDYYLGPYFQSFMRLVRYVSFLFNVLALPLFIAGTTYHMELLPTPLLLSIAGSKEGTPFPTAVESILMVLFFEILREASLRMPEPLGEIIAIVGALVIGQAAIQAGMVAAPVVIATALSAISSFVVPGLTELGALVRLLLIFLAATLGLFGLVMGALLVLANVVSTTSFGVPVTAPFAPFRLAEMQDAVVRFPWWAMRRRPPSLEPRDTTRQPGLGDTGPLDRK